MLQVKIVQNTNVKSSTEYKMVSKPRNLSYIIHLEANLANFKLTGKKCIEWIGESDEFFFAKPENKNIVQNLYIFI